MVAIIVILAAIAIPQFTKYRKQAAVEALMSDARNCITDVVAQITNATVSGGVIPDNGNYTNVSPNTGSAHGVVVITLIVLVLGTIILLLLVLTALPMLTDQ